MSARLGPNTEEEGTKDGAAEHPLKKRGSILLDPTSIATSFSSSPGRFIRANSHNRVAFVFASALA